MHELNTNLRINILKNKLQKEKHYGNILIFKDEDIFYLTGFYGKNSSSVFACINNKNYLLVNFIYYEEAKKLSLQGGYEAIIYDSNNKNELIAELLKSENINTVLMESNFLSFMDYVKIEEDLRKKNIKSIPIDYPLESLRIIKDNNEAINIRKACSITDKVFKALISKTKNGIIKYSESSLAFELESLALKKGALKKSFDYVSAFNENSSKPHHIASNNFISEGLILLDFGVVYNNYCSDITRTFFLGKKPDKKLIEIYKIVKEAQQAALDFCREGIEANKLDKIARDIISLKGYGENFGHSLGHGVGIEIHEPPWINKKNTAILTEGMVITIEPGIYIENLGGVRIEDMVIVKKAGCEVLYDSTKEIINIF